MELIHGRASLAAVRVINIGFAIIIDLNQTNRQGAFSGRWLLRRGMGREVVFWRLSISLSLALGDPLGPKLLSPRRAMRRVFY